MLRKVRARNGRAVVFVLGIFLAGYVAVTAVAQSKPESKNMELLGYSDLQGRSAYQPTIHKQGNRWIAYIGHHGGRAMNPLTGQMEDNGTSIVDVTDPKQPKYLAHIPGDPRIPGPGETGGAQMARVCDGSELPRADKSKVFLLRSRGTSSHEMWDVTDPAKPSRLTVVESGFATRTKAGGSAIPAWRSLFPARPAGARSAWGRSTTWAIRPSRSSSAISDCRASSPVDRRRCLPICTARSPLGRKAIAYTQATAPAERHDRNSGSRQTHPWTQGSDGRKPRIAA